MFYFIILIRQFSQSKPRELARKSTRFYFFSFCVFVSTRSLSLVRPALSIRDSFCSSIGGGTLNEHDYHFVSFIVPHKCARDQQNTIQ